MIPNKIHFCWFGGNKKPEIIENCIESWKRYMPEFSIIEWNERNYDIHKSKYMIEAYNYKKWAFVSDYARFDILNEYGGIYFDTDAELLKPIPQAILEHDAFTGIESAGTVNPGLVMGSIPKHPFLEQILNVYESQSFSQQIKEGRCKTVNEYTTEILEGYGFMQENTFQIVDGIAIYPSSIFCGYDQDTHSYDISEETVSVHHYAGSWKKKSTKNTIIRFLVNSIGINKYRKLLSIKRKLFGYSKH